MPAFTSEERSEAIERLDRLNDALHQMVYNNPTIRMHTPLMTTIVRLIQTGDYTPAGEKGSLIPDSILDVDAFIRRETKSLVEVKFAYARLFRQVANSEYFKTLTAVEKERSGT